MKGSKKLLKSLIKKKEEVNIERKMFGVSKKSKKLILDTFTTIDEFEEYLLVLEKSIKK